MRARSYRTYKADCRLPSAVSLLYGSDSRNAGKRKVEGKIKLEGATCIDDEKIVADIVHSAHKRVQYVATFSSDSSGKETKDRVACTTESSRSITSCAYFAANRCTGNELALSSRREYLRGPYTSTTTRTRCIRMKL